MKTKAAVLFLLAAFSVAAFAAEPVGKINYIDAESLWAKLKDKSAGKGDFTVVDLRIESEYAKGAIDGALNIPKKKLSFRANELDKSKEIVLYGYSQNDPSAVNASVWLANWGYTRIQILRGGWEAWKKTFSS